MEKRCNRSGSFDFYLVETVVRKSHALQMQRCHTHVTAVVKSFEKGTWSPCETYDVEVRLDERSKGIRIRAQGLYSFPTIQTRFESSFKRNLFTLHASTFPFHLNSWAMNYSLRKMWTNKNHSLRLSKHVNFKLNK